MEEPLTHHSDFACVRMCLCEPNVQICWLGTYRQMYACET